MKPILRLTLGCVSAALLAVLLLGSLAAPGLAETQGQVGGLAPGQECAAKARVAADARDAAAGALLAWDAPPEAAGVCTRDPYADWAAYCRDPKCNSDPCCGCTPVPCPGCN